MKKISLVLLVSLILTGCTVAETIPPDKVNTGVETNVEDVVEKPEPPKPETPKPELTEEEKAEKERIRKEKDEELRIKLEQAKKEREERMKIAEIAPHLSDSGMTLEEVMEQVEKEKAELPVRQAELKSKEELVSQQRSDILAAKEQNKPHVVLHDTEREILDVTNRHRAEVGAPPLIWSERRHRYATNYNLYMFTYSVWEHNIVYDSAENLYVSGATNLDKVDAEHIVDMWMNSPGHKKNLLNPLHRVMGAAVLRGKTKHPVTGEVKEVIFATQHFFDETDGVQN